MMIRTIGAVALLSIAAIVPPEPAAAQDALSGALLGGAATGRAGGALVGGLIGGTAGAVIGSEAQRRNSFYWHRGRCYQAVRGGYQPIPARYCY